MNKIFIPPLTLAALVFILVTGGCKKSDVTETWYWKGAGHSSSSCSAGTGSSAGTLTVQDAGTTLQVIFYGALPAKSGIDTVVAWGNASDATQVTVSLGAGGNTYQSTGGNGYNQTVNVTVSGGKVSVSAAQNNPIELQNILTNSYADSSGLYFNITQ
jgi:major membrane immunogen (membrane-anchored lipoprotein)